MAGAVLIEGPIDTGWVVRQAESRRYGAVVTFSGNVRDHAQGKRVVAIEYTAYAPLAQAELERIARDAEERDECSCAIAHRLGPIPIGEPSVFIAVGARHRAEAFDICRRVIDTIKLNVPIWKKETYDDGEVWIEGERTYPTETSA